jgi:hypothetical protein
VNSTNSLSDREQNQNASALSLEREMLRLKEGPGPDDFYSAMLNLQQFGESAFPRLTEVAFDASQPSGFRARALETAAMIGGRSIGEFLMQCATDPDFDVRFSAVAMIRNLRIHEALPLLKELLISDNREWQVQPGFVLSMKKGVTKAIASIESETK